jgi:hypothetical protein
VPAFHRRSSLAILLAAGASGLTASSAQARPQLTLDRACYSEEENMRLSGQGFTPGAKIAFIFVANGKLGQADTTADAAGAFTYEVRGPELRDFDGEPPGLDIAVTANDQSKFGPDGMPIGPPEESFALAEFRLSEWAVEVAKWEKRTATARRGESVRVATRGWTSAGDTLYLHYVRGGKAVHSQKVGPLRGDCGDLTKSIKTFAFKGVKPGRYSVRFSASPRWDADDAWLGYRSVRFTG